MRDFDTARAERDRDFRIGGEDFRMRAVKPEVLLAYQDMDEPPPPELTEARRAILRAQIEHPPVDGVVSAEVQLARMEADPLEDAFQRASAAAMPAKLDGIILELLDNQDDGHARYKALRERADDPLTLGDIQSLMGWMIGAQTQELEDTTGRPTGLPSPSTRGRGPTGTPSTGASSSPAAKAASKA